MGVPAFFRWLCSRNPKILLEAHENSDDPTTMSTNPTIDNLYLDMNGLIHPCSHPEGTGIPIPITFHDMFINVFNYIDRLVELLRPQQLIYMAVDGVAPRAKMNQQRSRRFRAAQESQRIQGEKIKLRDYWAAQGISHTNLDEYIANHFDTNQITPGTDFMYQLSYAIQYYIYDRLNNHPLFKDLTIIYSDASIPGEGEHKILQYIRDQRQQIEYCPNIRHCIYGADADLIMLGLSTHEPWFYIVRETIMSNEDRFCNICQEKGHFFIDCPKRNQLVDINLNATSVEPQKVRTINVNFQMIQLAALREFLSFEMRELFGQLKFEWNLERFIDDFVFMCFLVGNDFLPHIPCLKITDGGIDCLILTYKLVLPQLNNYLTHSGELILSSLNVYLQHIGQLEDDLIKGQERKKEIGNQRREQNPHPEGVKTIFNNEANAHDTKEELLEKFKSVLKEKIHIQNQAEMSAATMLQGQNQNKKWNFLTSKQRYYQEKFGIQASQFYEFINKLKQQYIEALAWTLRYYYQGCVDWGWFYPYHYAPYAQDLINIDQLSISFQLDKPFTPYQQLLAVLPAHSSQFLPQQYQSLMCSHLSPIADFYPTDFFVDLKGKKFAWLGEVVLPFIDADRLISASNINYASLSKIEQDRNRCGQPLLFIRASRLESAGLLVKVEWLQRFPLGMDIRSPLPTMPHISNNQIITGGITDTLLNGDPDFVQSRVLGGCIQPSVQLDDYYLKECEGNRRSFGGEAVRRIVYSIIKNNGQRRYQNDNNNRRYDNNRDNRDNHRDNRDNRDNRNNHREHHHHRDHNDSYRPRRQPNLDDLDRMQKKVKQ